VKLYRVAYFIEGGNSHGFTWHTSKKEVAQSTAQYAKDFADEGCELFEVEEVEVELTKAGVLRALRVYASHPDNG
jgi:hypothetical protein